MTVKYLGNKASQSRFIVAKIRQQIGSEGSLVGDLFSGTGAVAAQLKKNGFRVHANDHLKQCELRAKAILLLSHPPPFRDLEDLMRLEGKQDTITDSTYHRVLSYLNRLEGEEGFFFREYCPEGSQQYTQWERKYFTKDNAKSIDAIRAKIAEWKSDGSITDLEHSLLLVDLIEAVNDVANISGTYGCFLKEFESNAVKPLHMLPFNFISGSCNHLVTMEDVFETSKDTPSNMVYLDPPFTKRQYVTYYHIPETIALEDEPQVLGKTGIRPWERKASDFCYKSRALLALKRLLESLRPRDIYLSYSSDGHIWKQDVLRLVEEFGEVRVFEYGQKRFKSGMRTANGSDLREYLFCLEGGT